MNIIPVEAQNSKVEFKYAAAWLKRAVKACHFSPKFFSVKRDESDLNREGTGDHFIVWNTRRVVEFDESDRAYAEQYL